MNEEVIEKEIQDKNLKGPRITPGHIDSLCSETQYHRFPGTNTIVCCIKLTNGFTVTGESACVDPSNFDEEIGKKVAFNKARDKIWVLEGYLLNYTLNVYNKK